MTPGPARARWSLTVKLTVGMVLLALVPLVVSAILVGQLSRVAANFAANEASVRDASMERALGAYRELFATTKQLHGEILERLAADPALIGPAGAPLTNALTQIVTREPQVYRLRIVDGDDAELGAHMRPLPDSSWRYLDAEHALADGRRLVASFAVPARLQDDYQHMATVLEASRSVTTVRSALGEGFRTAFLAIMAGAVALAALAGVLFARHLDRRVQALVRTARQVSAGRTSARVRLTGRDELAELGLAFNTMLDDLAAKRLQIEYLQRIGAWEDVARRLAHEIKNPLTPIQLAVQQCVSAYPGEDPRFTRLLRDTGEIVEEEIEGLRRLVDTFRTLGQLPKVEPASLDLAALIEDLRLDPQFAEALTLVPPAGPLAIAADRLLLKRVLANLVENGLHAGAEAHGQGRGHVTITWLAHGRDAVEIHVDDNGKGVAATARTRIFEPYVTSKQTGTGLGLAIARKIALEHGGDLALAESPAPTGGARFSLTLPVLGPRAATGSMPGLEAMTTRPAPGEEPGK